MGYKKGDIIEKISVDELAESGGLGTIVKMLKPDFDHSTQTINKLFLLFNDKEYNRMICIDDGQTYINNEKYYFKCEIIRYGPK